MKTLPRLLALFGALALAVPALGAGQSGEHRNATHDMQQKKMMMMQQAEAMSPWRGYMQAHDGVKHPLPLLGGPIKISISQKRGGVFVALPAHRKLDPAVFGTPKHPRAFGGFPIASGLPLMLRGVKDGHYTEAKKLSPFGDKTMVLPDGYLMLNMIDATATDAATTRDSVKLDASWKDRVGNTYEVRCCKMMAAHGVDYPTFGGVLTNAILHGSSRIGTPLMPTEYTYADFWGMGEVLKNGKVLQAPRLVHVMLTEYVRGSGYTLDFDKDVTPTKVQFHLMLPPVMPEPAKGTFRPDPVNTGFKLPNGMTLPFWHVMFENLTVTASRTEATQQFWPPHD